MSVIGLNLWINLQVLKSTYQQLQIHIKSQIRQIYKQTNNYISIIVQKMLTQISTRDKIIEQLKNKNNTININKIYSNSDVSNSCQQNLYDKDVENMNIQILKQNYKQILQQNKQYQSEFLMLVNQLKTIKLYIEQLKQIKSKQNQNNSSAKLLQNSQQDQILAKISSLNRFQSIKIPQILDTIKEVTEISVHSQQQQQNEQQKQQKQYQQQIEYFNPSIYASIAQSKSFQCINQVSDIKNTLFDNNSRQISINLPNQSYQTFQHSLSVLKNYCNTSNQKQQQQIQQQFVIPNLDQLVMPILILKQIVNQRHLIFQNGYVFTGNTVKIGYNQIRPLGFGQLFLNHKLLYCGEWKNGVFDGWGKLYFPQKSIIKNFNGKWVQGVASGPSTIRFWNNDKFVGTLKNIKANGDGVYYKNNQKFFRGYWKDNRFIKPQ